MSRGLFNAALGMPTGTAVHQAGTTLMPTLKKLGTQRKAQPGHIMNSNIPPEFVQAYHEIVQKGTTDKEAIRTALIQEFTDVTPESLRNMLIEQTLQTMLRVSFRVRFGEGRGARLPKALASLLSGHKASNPHRFRAPKRSCKYNCLNASYLARFSGHFGGERLATLCACCTPASPRFHFSLCLGWCKALH
jgi:hypothetical protein